MAALVLPDTRGNQYQINRAHPLAASLVAAIVPSPCGGRFFVDLVTGARSSEPSNSERARPLPVHSPFGADATVSTLRYDGDDTEWTFPAYATGLDRLTSRGTVFAWADQGSNGDTNRVAIVASTAYNGSDYMGVSIELADGGYVLNGIAASLSNTGTGGIWGSSFDLLGTAMHNYSHRFAFGWDGTNVHWFGSGRKESGANTNTAGSYSGRYTRIGGYFSGSSGKVCNVAVVYGFDRVLTPAEYQELWRNPLALLTRPARRIYFTAGGGATTRTGTLSLEAAIRYARTAIASVDAGVQIGRTSTLSFDAALRIARTAFANLEAAIRAARTANATLDGYVQAGSSRTTSIDSAIRVALTGTASIDAAISKATTALANLDSAVMVARNATANLDAAIKRTISGTANIDGYIQAGSTVSASIDAAIRYARSAAVSVDAALSLSRSATASLDARIIVASAGQVAIALDGAIAVATAAIANLDVAIRWNRVATLQLDGFIFDPASVEPEGFTFRSTGRVSFRARKRAVN